MLYLEDVLDIPSFDDESIDLNQIIDHIGEDLASD
jgi:hypothetical protein